ncbi:MAG: methylmalonyl-CoA mutase family protein, partial [Spirochaetota bacterium]|nr:methylmalonyl-CoA mutase family protein [Spirochaetota bacterium]
MKTSDIYKPKNKIRVLTSTALFDGHDVAINIMRRVMQASGVEVMHLGHNRSVNEIVNCAIQEDVHAIAVSSYQGGHLEYYKYLYDSLKKNNANNIKIFGGGGGVILPHEKTELENYGITKLYSPDDARELGLQGMINDVLEKSDYPIGKDIEVNINKLNNRNHSYIAKLISSIENNYDNISNGLIDIKRIATEKLTPIIGITGTGGSGKSSLIDELLLRILKDSANKSIAIISVDPTKRKTGGALLGDRIRMNNAYHTNVYMRSMATRQSSKTLPNCISDVINILKLADFDLILLESSGIGQSDSEITDYSNISMYVMTPEYGSNIQLEKIDMIDFADIVVLNKFDKMGSLDALYNIRKQYQRSHNLWDRKVNEMPVYPTIASQFNDSGINKLYTTLAKIIEQSNTAKTYQYIELDKIDNHNNIEIIPSNRVRYLSEIAETIREYNDKADEQSITANQLYALNKTIDLTRNEKDEQLIVKLKKIYTKLDSRLTTENKKIIENWDSKAKLYSSEQFKFDVRDKEISVNTYSESLSKLKIPKVSLPKYESWGDILKWSLKENLPGEFPYAAGVYPFKRETEDSTRMFAGEGSPERTNRRFHYLSSSMKFKRLSTAFDSVTLYGENPDSQPDIYGKIGNSGVSIGCLDDTKKLYSGFDLTNPTTSVSMTINGPAPILTAFYINTAIDQQCEKYIKKHGLENKVRAKITKIYKENNLP